MIRNRYIVLLIFFITVLSCEKETGLLPPFKMEVSPSSGLTTSIYTFDLTKTLEYYGNDRIFVRWDWEGDSIFDTPFQNEKIFNHRYFAPGTYNPKAEIKNLKGSSKDTTFQIIVGRGYSAPRSAFTISPDGGHIHTEFILDAGITTDDEDSLSTLLFKWDFEGDGIWDTNLDKTIVVSHKYPEPKVYLPRLYAEDPLKRGSTIENRLEVTLIDTCITPSFVTIPELFIQNEDVIFDASGSYNSCTSDEDYQFRWDYNYDGYFDTEWSENPVDTHSFPIEQYYIVNLEVRSSRSLENSTSKRFWIYHQNQAPRAKFTVSTYGGNTKTSIRFDSWSSRDLEDSPSQMQSRWDWDNDGIWDSEYDYEKVVFHTFDNPGKYTVAMELVDRGGLKDTTFQVIYINENSYETDILIDKRGYNWSYYGTVKIGSQWWFSKNLMVNDRRIYQNWPYPGEGLDIDFYGYLYPYYTHMVVCPDGWRVPSREDWAILLENLPSDDYYNELLLGGGTGFNAVLGGAKGFLSGSTGSKLGKYGYYLSSTKVRDQSATSSWVIELYENTQEFYQGFGHHQHSSYFSVRCMRDE